MFWRKKKAVHKSPSKVALAHYQTMSAGQRTQTGDRLEMAGGMNNNQKFAALQMLRDFKD